MSLDVLMSFGLIAVLVIVGFVVVSTRKAGGNTPNLSAEDKELIKTMKKKDKESYSMEDDTYANVPDNMNCDIDFSNVSLDSFKFE